MASVNNVSLTAPTDYALEQQKIARQQKLAEALQQQAFAASPTEYAPGGWAVKQSPLGGLGRLAQAFAGMQMQNKADSRLGELATQQRGDQSADMSALVKAMQGTPAQAAQPGMVDEVGGINAPELPAQAAKPGGLQNIDMNALRTPETRQMVAKMMMEQAAKASEPYSLAPGAGRYQNGVRVAEQPKPAEPFTLNPSDTRYGADGKPIVTAPAAPIKNEGAWGNPYPLNGVLVQKNSLTGEIKTAVSREPQVHINQAAPVTAVTVQDPANPNATIVIDGRTGKQLGKGPKLTETGRSNFKQQAGMQGLGNDLQTAEDLLLGNVRDSEGNVTKGNLPTGSGLGSIYDSVAGLVGVSPAGAAEADQLKVLGARLVGKVPRMEGPQSDKDVLLYKQAAGDAGNDKLPRERRLAAVRRMKEIYSGYEDGSRGRLLQDSINNSSTTPNRRAADSAPDAPPPGAVRLKGG